MSELLLEAEALLFGPRGVALTGPADFGVRSGQTVAVLGPNGAGKTTLFRTLLGILAPISGQARCAGRPVSELPGGELARQIAYVPQSPGAAFDFTLEHYVLLGRLALRGAIAAPGRADRQAVDAAIERLGLAHLARRPLSQMSGGERQLAALARAFAQQARLLVLDEPAASLDLGNQARVLDTLASLARERLAIVFSTHDPNHALRIATHALLVVRDADPVYGPVGEIVRADRLSQVYRTSLEAARGATGGAVIALAPGACPAERRTGNRVDPRDT